MKNNSRNKKHSTKSINDNECFTSLYEAQKFISDLQNEILNEDEELVTA